jgi:hypothetical protein
MKVGRPAEPVKSQEPADKFSIGACERLSVD